MEDNPNVEEQRGMGIMTTALHGVMFGASSHYSAAGDVLSNFGTRLEVSGVHLKDYLSKSILEIGSGCTSCNALSADLQKVGDYHAIADNETMVRVARSYAKSPDKIIKGDPVKLPYSDGRFDLVISNMVYFHRGYFGLGDSAKLARETRRVMKHGGIYLLVDAQSDEDLFREFDELTGGSTFRVLRKPLK